MNDTDTDTVDIIHSMDREQALAEIVYHPAWAYIVAGISEFHDIQQSRLETDCGNFDIGVEQLRYDKGRIDSARMIMRHLEEIESDAKTYLAAPKRNGGADKGTGRPKAALPGHRR